MTQDIYSKIERYSDLGFGIDILNNDKQALKDSVIPADIKAKLAEIDAEFDGKMEALSMERATLEAEIKEAVLQAGQSLKGTHHCFTFVQPAAIWNDKAVLGFAISNPQLMQFRKEKPPFVQVRKAWNKSTILQSKAILEKTGWKSGSYSPNYYAKG